MCFLSDLNSLCSASSGPLLMRDCQLFWIVERFSDTAKFAGGTRKKFLNLWVKLGLILKIRVWCSRLKNVFSFSQGLGEVFWIAQAPSNFLQPIRRICRCWSPDFLNLKFPLFWLLNYGLLDIYLQFPPPLWKRLEPQRLKAGKEGHGTE